MCACCWSFWAFQIRQQCSGVRSNSSCNNADDQSLVVTAECVTQLDRSVAGRVAWGLHASASHWAVGRGTTGRASPRFAAARPRGRKHIASIMRLCLCVCATRQSCVYEFCVASKSDFAVGTAHEWVSERKLNGRVPFVDSVDYVFLRAVNWFNRVTRQADDEMEAIVDVIENCSWNRNWRTEVSAKNRENGKWTGGAVLKEQIEDTVCLCVATNIGRVKDGEAHNVKS